MEPKLKIVLINHTFQINYFSRRWELFAQKYQNVDITLFAPAEFEWYGKGYSFGKSNTLKGKELDNGNFHKRLYRVKKHEPWGWTSPDFKDMLIEIKPDFVYYLGFHTQLSLLQVIKLTKKYLPEAKMLTFSMRGPYHNLHLELAGLSLVKKIRRIISYSFSKYVLSQVISKSDAIFCHYPDAVDCFRQEGYKGPIFMQTQVGVNTEWFHEDLEARKMIRDKYNLGDAFVFGSASRFTSDKGLLEIIQALPQSGNWKFLMMGAGTTEEENEIRRLIEERGLQNKIILTGFVDWYDMTKYWNAVDCAIHVPRTTKTWVETFSLSVVQPMATKKPIIGNTSGSVPYQIGFKDMIVPENDINALREKIEWILNNQDAAKQIGNQMYERTLNSFTVEHLNNLFYLTLLDIHDGRYDERKQDMVNYPN